MIEKCCACGKPFANGDLVVLFHFEQVKAGEKSGALGFYESTQSPEGEPDYVHFEYACLEKCFSPMDNPFMYDMIAEAVRKEAWEDALEKEERDLPLFMDEDPPFCLWCKKEDTVWMQIQRDMHVYNCLQCRKLWDHNEDELYWDPETNTYKFVEY